MRHQKAGKKLGVTVDHRRAMLRMLTLAIIENDAIKTTHSRAKELRWYADHVVTLAKAGDVAGRRQIISLLGSTETQPNKENRVRAAIDRVYKELVPRFKDRTGGYTQILRLAKRRVGDNADMCVMRYIPPVEEKKDKGTKGKKEAKKKVEAAAAAGENDKKPREKKSTEGKASKTAKKEKDKA